VENISSCSLKKTSDQRKLRLLSDFFLSDKIDQSTNFAKLLSVKMSFFDITANFITQKLKSRHLAISVFSGQRFF
jgi:hypothetical protein